MNDKEFENIAKKLLDKEYSSYEITVNIHTAGTNERTIEAKVDDLTITLIFDNETGKLLHKTKSRSNPREIVEKPIQITDFVTRIVEGIRFKTNRYALFALIVIIGFQIFILINRNDVIILVFELTLGFLLFVTGFFSIVRIENMLRITMRNALSLKHEKIKQNQNTVSRRCNECNHRWTSNSPCPKCGSNDVVIIGVVNEVVQTHESSTTVTRNHLSKINYLGMGFFSIIVIIQSYLTINLGGITELIISLLIGFLTFIPSYYAFLKIHFIDKESFR